jgi:hypothetical protein
MAEAIAGWLARFVAAQPGVCHPIGDRFGVSLIPASLLLAQDKPASARRALGKPKLWRPEAFTSAHPENWSAFLGSLPGEPRRIVCDAHGGMLRAIEARWPNAERHLCEWHLQHALERLLAKEARARPGDELDALRAPHRGRAREPVLLASLRSRGGAAGIESLDRWFDVNDPIIESQFARRGRASQRPADMPLTTAALEQLARPIVTALHHAATR